MVVFLFSIMGPMELEILLLDKIESIFLFRSANNFVDVNLIKWVFDL